MKIAAQMPRKRVQTGDVLTLLERHKIQVLLEAEFSVAEVARRTGASLDTVRRVKGEVAVSHTDDAAERRQRRIGRPSKTQAFADRVRAWLAEEPELPTQELLRRAREAGYDGHKTAFYALVAGARPVRATPVVRFEGLPGEFSQHDFGHVDVRFVDGRKKRVHFFASRLKYSRYVAVSLVEDERVETVVRSLARHFVAFGGRPLMAVFDRPRTIVARSGKGREVEAFNATFAQAIVEIGVGVEMCAPRSGNQKGSVERLVGWVKSAFFKPRKFVDEADLRAQLDAWLVEANTRTPSRATGVIPEIRRLEELPRLRPVQVLPETLALRIPVTIGPTAELYFEGVPYSMPPEATRVPGTLYLYEDRLRIVAGRYEAVHRRRKKGEPPAPLPEHRVAKVAAVHGKRAKLYEKREQLLQLCPAALALLTEITHREPKLASRRVEELYAMLEAHGDEVLRAALTHAVEAGRTSVAGVRMSLRQGAGAQAPHRATERSAHASGHDSSQQALPLGRAQRDRGAP